jgi:hypothetical protein
MYQKAVGAKVDGRIGPNTLAAASRATREQVSQAISQSRIKYHEAKVRKNPSQAKFMNGWRQRAEALTEPAPIYASAATENAIGGSGGAIPTGDQMAGGGGGGSSWGDEPSTAPPVGMDHPAAAAVRRERGDTSGIPAVGEGLDWGGLATSVDEAIRQGLSTDEKLAETSPAVARTTEPGMSETIANAPTAEIGNEIDANRFPSPPSDDLNAAPVDIEAGGPIGTEGSPLQSQGLAGVLQKLGAGTFYFNGQEYQIGDDGHIVGSQSQAIPAKNYPMMTEEPGGGLAPPEQPPFDARRIY